MTVMHIQDQSRKGAKVKTRQTDFYCNSCFNSSDLEINKNEMLKEYSMLEHIQRI